MADDTAAQEAAAARASQQATSAAMPTEVAAPAEAAAGAGATGAMTLDALDKEYAARLAAMRLPRNVRGDDARIHAGQRAMLAPGRATAVDSAEVRCFAEVDLGAPPLTAGLNALAVAPSLTAWTGRGSQALLNERTAYAVATAHVPAWVHADTQHTGGLRSAASLFLGEGAPGDAPAARPYAVNMSSVPWDCAPALLARPREQFHPAFNGKFTSGFTGRYGYSPMMDEVLVNATLGMLGSYFRDVPSGVHRFFRSPPVAFSLAAFAHVGYILAVEWVGRLHVTVVSQPFFLGSDEHRAAVARLPDADLSGAYVDVNTGVDVAAYPSEDDDQQHLFVTSHQPVSVFRRAQPPAPDDADQRFFKVVLGGAGYIAGHFRGMYAAYAALATAREDPADPPPPSLVRAELLFGAGAVCVRMPWVFGRDATYYDLDEGGVAVRPMADALVWLARHRLLYIDLRPPNVRVSEGDVQSGTPGPVLIDYDDMRVLERAPASADELRELLEDHEAAFAQVSSPGYLDAVMAALDGAWDGAGGP
jgi:hypothetical protein